MKILITGGTGFIGSHYADAFIERGHAVTVFDAAPQIHEFRARYVQGTLQDRSTLGDEIRKCDFVIHAAGILGTHETVPAALDTTMGNVIGGLNVLEEVREYGNNLLNISKPNVWLNPYSITKDCMEKFCFMYAKEYRSKIAILKLYNVYGTRQKFSHIRKAIPTWIINALNDKPVEIFGSGAATMDLVHTKDVCEGTVKIVENFDSCRIHASDDIAVDVWGNFLRYNHQVLELGSGLDISVNNAVEVLGRALDKTLDVRHLPMRRGEIDGTRLCANNSRLQELTGYEPKVSLEDGLRDTVEYYRKHAYLIGEGKL